MSEGRQSERLKGKVPINYSDTRKINSPNRYSILDPDDKTVVEETIEFITERDGGDNGDDEDDKSEDTEDWFVIDTTMSEDKKSHKVDLGLSEKEMLPIDEAELWQVYQFTRLRTKPVLVAVVIVHPGSFQSFSSKSQNPLGPFLPLFRRNFLVGFGTIPKGRRIEKGRRRGSIGSRR